MRPELPAWALMRAGPADRLAIRDAHARGVITLKWKAERAPRGWAKQQGWPAPWFGFDDAFVSKMLESDEHLELALAGSGVEVYIPKPSHAIADAELAELDALYQDHAWRALVDELREIRRAVEAGVVVSVGGTTLRSWEGFYSWAHGRYHALEDDVRTAWIGDDSRHP